MTDHPDHNQPRTHSSHGPDCACPADMPPAATVVEVVGGSADGLTVAVVDTRDTALALIVDHEGNLNVQTRLHRVQEVLPELDPVQTYKVLSQITKAAQAQAREWLAAQS